MGGLWALDDNDHNFRPPVSLHHIQFFFNITTFVLVIISPDRCFIIKFKKCKHIDVIGKKLVSFRSRSSLSRQSWDCWSKVYYKIHCIIINLTTTLILGRSQLTFQNFFHTFVVFFCLTLLENKTYLNPMSKYWPM